MQRLIAEIESSVRDPSSGLPYDLFLFVSRLTPLVNVDLLIKSAADETLLTWRDDGFGPPGWHVPGGIIRYREGIATRIKAVAKTELGAQVEHGGDPLAMHEIILPSSRNRAHAISLLYGCSLTSPPDERLMYRSGAPRPGEWAWHEHAPDDLIPVHEIYRKHMSPRASRQPAAPERAT